ncbi:3-hydroxyacyl-CoA dehydrogenase family protein [[Kitasatospora] papulosa]
MQDRKSPRSPRRWQSRRTANESAAHRATRSADQLYAHLYAAPPLLPRMVDAGRLGRKTGLGFYLYD